MSRSRDRRTLVGALVVAVFLCLLARSANAHNRPISRVDVRVDDKGASLTVEAPAIDLAHDFPDVTADDLLAPGGAQAKRDELSAILAARLLLADDTAPLPFELVKIEPLAAQRDIRLRLRLDWTAPPARLQIRCRLFPYDARHKTFLTVFVENTLERQAIFDGETSEVDVVLRTNQGLGAVIRQFLYEGLHHIFIGPDHILFVVGLLLAGGTLKQLLRIVTAFTVAHSITLVFATLDILHPPSRIVEPAIALSIVIVGVDALRRGERKRDLRLAFAFCFGFIHGFGFASVLRGMDLPRSALGWSLFSFNVGVEAGQACIVLAVVPLLTLLRRRSALLTGRVVTAGSVGVVAAGSFWLVERLFFEP